MAQAASALHAESHRHHYRDGDGERFTPFTAEVATFVTTLHLLDANARLIDDGLADLPAVHLTYEDDLATPEAQQAARSRICAALGLEPVQASTTPRGLASARPADRLANWEDIAAALRLTRSADLVPDG